MTFYLKYQYNNIATKRNKINNNNNNNIVIKIYRHKCKYK